MAKRLRAEKAASITAESGNWSSLHNTPLEIWREMLCYLPVKSLVRLRSVSKSWKSIIEESAFASSQLLVRYNNNKNLVPPLIVNEFDSKKWWVYCSKIYQKISEIKSPPIEVDFTNWFFRGARDGLVLFQSSGVLKNTLMLWNPSIQKSVYISPPPIQSSSEYNEMVVVLGFDPSEDDYKVITSVSNPIAIQPLFQVFSLKSRSWTEVKYSVVGKSPEVVSHCWDNVSIGEYIHWIGVISDDSNHERYTLVSLNLTTMTILYTPIPDQYCYPRFFLVGSFIGILIGGQVWVLKDLGLDPSWQKMFETKVDISNLPYLYVYLTKDGVLLTWESNTSKLYVFDFNTGEENEFPYSGNLTLPVIINNYVESLVLLNWR